MAILVMDPAGSAAALADALRQRGCQVTSASGAAQSQDRRDHADYDVGVCVAAAHEALAPVQALAESLPETPLLLVTDGVPAAKLLLEVMRLGVVDVVDRRSPPQEQAEVIAEAIQRSARQATRQQHRRDVAPAADGLSISAQQLRTEAQLRELQRDQRAGRYIQMGMLPPSPMAIDGYRLRHKIFPSLMLSGDFVDYFRVTDRHFAFYIADVSGHGASSAFVTVLLKNFSRRLRREYTQQMLRDPGEVLAWLNREMLDNQLDKHVVAFFGMVDLVTNELMFANAGHYPSAILVDDKGARFLELAGKPVGLFRDVSYESKQEQLVPGCSLFLVSDGVLEALGDGRLAEREQQLLNAAMRAHEGVDELWQVLDLAQHESSQDDMSCLALSRAL
jgi:phosphoserine phosphatase RsbU/P